MNRTPGPVEIALVGYMGLAWGSSFMMVELAIATMPPITVTAVRTIMASVGLVLAVRLMGLRFPGRGRIWLVYLAMGTIGTALPMTLVNVGQLYIDSSLTAILMATSPIFTVLLAQFFDRADRLTVPKVLGIGFGFVGTILLIGPEALGGLSEGMLGQLACIAASFGFAGLTLLASHTRGYHPLVTAAGVQAVAAIASVPLALLFEQPWAVSPSALSLAAVVGLALFASLLSNLALLRVVRATTPSFASLYNYIVPMVGALLGAFILDEPLGWREIGALCVILFGIAVASGRLSLPAVRRRNG